MDYPSLSHFFDKTVSTQFLNSCITIFEMAWTVWISGQFIFVFRWYEWILWHRVPELEQSVWNSKHNASNLQKSAWNMRHIVSELQKSAPNLRHNYAWGAEVCPKTGASLCLGGNDMAKSGDNIARCAIWVPEIWDTIMPGGQKRVRNLGHDYARCAITVSKLGQIIARCAETCPRSEAYKWNSKMVCPESGVTFCPGCKTFPWNLLGILIP